MTAKQIDNDEPRNVWDFFRGLLGAEPLTASEDEVPWFEPGRLYEIDQRTYWYFLELLPPRWMQGNVFAFGEGSGPFRLFWQVQDAYFARELTNDETRTFCDLTGVSLHL